MVLEEGGSGWGSGCLASRHCGILQECKFGLEEVGAAGLVKKLNIFIFNFLISSYRWNLWANQLGGWCYCWCCSLSCLFLFFRRISELWWGGS